MNIPKIIADELYRYNIPYKYEMPIQLRVGNRSISFYPDFTAMNKRTGKRWVIEHFGMMDKTSYYENALQKLDRYEKNNMLVGVDLIFLHETSSVPLNINSLRKYIETYLCWEQGKKLLQEDKSLRNERLGLLLRGRIIKAFSGRISRSWHMSNLF